MQDHMAGNGVIRALLQISYDVASPTFIAFLGAQRCTGVLHTLLQSFSHHSR